MIIRELIEKAVLSNPDKIFMYFEDESITYQDLDLSINKRANYFLSAGIGRGDKVALFLPNCPEFLYIWFGLAKIGAIMVPINTGCKGAEAEYIINHSDSRMVVVSSNYLDIVLGITDKCAKVESIVLTDGVSRPEIPIMGDVAETCPVEVPHSDIGDDDPVCILYTSGTTGVPKGCVLSNDYYTLTGQQWGACNSITSEDRLFTYLPLFHMNAQSTTTMAALVHRASIVLIPRFSSSQFWAQIDKYQATIFNYIGATLAFIENLPESPMDTKHTSLKRIYGGGANGEQLKRVQERYNLTATEGYGSTEDCISITNYYLDGPRKLGSIGKAAQGRQAKIVDDDDNELPPNRNGEIVTKGKPMMLEYFKEPEATAQAMRGGWFHTGDNGYRDEQGFFYFSERKKDIIRRAGENISAVEVENVIKSHPKIMDAAAIGVPDKIRKEEVKVYVILEPGETEESVPPMHIIRFASDKLACFKIPRYIEYRDRDFPRTPTNKVQKHELKKEKDDLTEGCFDHAKAGTTK